MSISFFSFPAPEGRSFRLSSALYHYYSPPPKSPSPLFSLFFLVLSRTSLPFPSLLSSLPRSPVDNYLSLFPDRRLLEIRSVARTFPPPCLGTITTPRRPLSPSFVVSICLQCEWGGSFFIPSVPLLELLCSPPSGTPVRHHRSFLLSLSALSLSRP